MRHHLACLGALVLLALAALPLAHAQFWSPETAGLSGYAQQPVWNDEFNGDSIDTTKWAPEVAAWPHNGELEYYTDSPEHTKVGGGLLTIIADKKPNGGRDYTSARWSTKDKHAFRQGVFAARMRLPYGQGIWPAFWLFGNGPIYSEIGIVEMIGGDAAEKGTGQGNDKVYASILWYGKEVGGPIFRPTNAASQTVAPARFADSFHIFWAEWNEEKVIVGFDDSRQELADISAIEAFRNTTMHLILNLAVGGGWSGPPDESTVFPQKLEVDWVRVWAKNSPGGAVGPVEPVPSETNGSTGSSEQQPDNGTSTPPAGASPPLGAGSSNPPATGTPSTPTTETPTTPTTGTPTTGTPATGTPSTPVIVGEDEEGTPLTGASSAGRAAAALSSIVLMLAAPLAQMLM